MWARHWGWMCVETKKNGVGVGGMDAECKFKAEKYHVSCFPVLYTVIHFL